MIVPRPVLIAGLIIILSAAIYAKGRVDGASALRAQLIEAREASREAQAKLEAQRLATEAERAALQQSLEDEARAQPVAHPECLPADRVRRLDRLR